MYVYASATAWSNSAMICCICSSRVIRLLSTTKQLNYKSSKKDGTMSFRNGYNYVKTLAAVITNVEHIGYITDLADAGTHYVVQGGCTDGKYIYACLEDQKPYSGDPDYYHNTQNHTTVIYKWSIETGKTVAKSEPLSLDHANDMAYDSKTNELIVAHCGFKDARSKIEFVISTEPTDGGIYRGHRGRMEIRVDMHGVSCHGSAPERGDNAIHKMAEVLLNVRDLNENDAGDDKEVKGLVKMLDPKYNPEHWEDARFLGRGTCTTSQIFYTSPSRCAVADSCSISIDRRMTAGETYQSCLKEIEDLPACKKYAKDVKVSMYMYDRPSWTGHVYETEAFFPTWINKETAPHVQALVDAHHALWGTERIGADEKAMSTRTGRPLTDKWTFSTNGVSIQGRYGIPCVGFGPGAESQAHAPNEVTFKQDLVTCAALYAAVPGLYKPENKDGSATSFRQELTGNDIK